MLKRLLAVSVVVILAVLSISPFSAAESKSKRRIQVGDVFPSMSFKVPEGLEDRAYLGLESEDLFAVEDIRADLVLVEILNVHCVHCQDQAPFYNELYKMIEQDASSRDRIKFIGFAVGNNEFEVKYFKHKYKVPFPILSDLSFEMHKAIGGGSTPFSIFVKLEKEPKATVVARTHAGVNEDYIRLYEDMQALMTVDLAAIQKRGRETTAEMITVGLPMPEAELMQVVREAMEEGADESTEFQRIDVEDSPHVYTGLIHREGQQQRLFAEVVSRPTICDVCHDVHFFYIFNEKGKILQFVPLQLTKYGNEEWSEEDVEYMRRRLVGRYVYRPFDFDPEVDAVTEATISSVVIFDSMAQAKNLYDAIKEKGLVQ